MSKRGGTSLFAQDAMTSKKSAFYTKPSASSDGISNAAIPAESNPVVTISKEMNPMKSRLVEEVTKEDVRAIQLESLLDAFQSAVEEKEQLITLETQILSEIRDVKKKVNDETMLSELNVAIDEKSRLIDAERAICKEISAVSSSLASEIDETRDKIVRLQNVIDALPDAVDATSAAAAVDYQSLLKSSIDVSPCVALYFMCTWSIFAPAYAKICIDLVVATQSLRRLELQQLQLLVFNPFVFAYLTLRLSFYISLLNSHLGLVTRRCSS